ncbi:hypothetical protein [Prauserella cavernicola]|uniref:Uncharacterized protein n=1 Tax=Prauserella cavernicola TaxID=2800127 RepID=A0A934V5T9_9PSEU|nr:hypothetical protein [Prauserella cavernicola]MBK1786024.1 hypothetical protein [Prauserella cavernicola]
MKNGLARSLVVAGIAAAGILTASSAAFADTSGGQPGQDPCSGPITPPMPALPSVPGLPTVPSLPNLPGLPGLPGDVEPAPANAVDGGDDCVPSGVPGVPPGVPSGEPGVPPGIPSGEPGVPPVSDQA